MLKDPTPANPISFSPLSCHFCHGPTLSTPFLSPKEVKAWQAITEYGEGAASKRSKNLAAESEDVAMMDGASEPTQRRSGRSSAGTGGRVTQLKKIGAALETRVKKPHQVTDFPENALENPLAPEKPRKGGRRSKKTSDDPPGPPPYSSTIPVSAATAGSMTSAPVPGFHHRTSDSERFGFHAAPSQLPPIVPPGTEPNLQALNNPYVAATIRVGQASGSPLSSLSRSENATTLVSTFRSTSSGQACSPSVQPSLPPISVKPLGSQPLYRNSTTFRQTSTNLEVGDYQIDPAILSALRNGHSAPVSRIAVADDGDSSSAETTISGERELASSDDEDQDADDGWGRTNSQRTIHPGFLQEHRSSEPLRHNSLPAGDFDFEHSRDEADDAAQQILWQPNEEQEVATRHDDADSQEFMIGGNDAGPRAPGEPSNTERRQEIIGVDVLDRHHRTNGRPSAPDPVQLAALPGNAANEAEAQANADQPRTRAPRNSKKPKDAAVSPDTLAFYPPGWRDLLEEAKRDCRIKHMLSNPFPSKSCDLKNSVLESLATSLTVATREGTKFEPDYWPEYKYNMAAVLLADISTWRSDLKTVALDAAWSAYGLIPPPDVEPQERPQWVMARATSLLSDSLFLRGGFDENGKTKNFAHPALQQVITEFYYLGTYRIADKRPDLFRESIPPSALALVASAYNCVLDGFSQNGSAKGMPHFSGKGYASIYRALLSIIDQEVLTNPYHGQRLTQQLTKWGKEAWAALQTVDKNVVRHDHLHVVLD